MRQHGIHLHGKKGNLVARWRLEDGRCTLEADDPLCLIVKGEDKGGEVLTQGAFANWLIAFFASFIRCNFQANPVSSD
jgi:hypothetical protein